MCRGLTENGLVPICNNLQRLVSFICLQNSFEVEQINRIYQCKRTEDPPVCGHQYSEENWLLGSGGRPVE